jgi:hypothetical protein
MSTVKHTAKFQIGQPIEILFPLFSAEGEKLWVPGWDYENIMRSTALHEDYIFLTKNHDHASTHYKWVDSSMQTDNSDKEDRWTQGIAVGSKPFVEKMKETLGFRATGRKIICADDTFELREGQTPYSEANDLDSGNTFLWDQPSPSLIGQFLHEK